VVNIPVTPPPIMSAATMRPAIAHDGSERPPLGAAAATGSARRRFGFALACVVVVGGVGADVVGAVVV
jgi:hypothetical protein